MKQSTHFPGYIQGHEQQGPGSWTYIDEPLGLMIRLATCESDSGQLESFRATVAYQKHTPGGQFAPQFYGLGWEVLRNEIPADLLARAETLPSSR